MAEVSRALLRDGRYDMAEVSRAQRNGHYDRAFVLVSELTGNPLVGAAFLVESGVPVNELPLGAVRALVEAAS